MKQIAQSSRHPEDREIAIGEKYGAGDWKISNRQQFIGRGRGKSKSALE
jgi:hypothetical protein